MYLAIMSVQPITQNKLHLTFEDGEKREFDMNPYINNGIFKDLKDVRIFNSVRVSFDTIEWENEADLDPEFLYTHSTLIKD